MTTGSFRNSPYNKEGDHLWDAMGSKHDQIVSVHAQNCVHVAQQATPYDVISYADSNFVMLKK